MISSAKGKSVFIIFLAVLLFLVAVLALHVGAIPVPVTTVFHEIARGLGLPAFGTAPTQEQMAVFWYIRMPRIAIAVLAGAALAASGSVMQGVFSNPLADPGIIGVSSGASFGAVICIYLGLTSVSMYYMPAFALLGAVFSVAAAIFLTLHNGKMPPMSLLLAGVAVSIFLGAMTNGLLTFMNEYRLKEFLFWMVGGLDYRRWEHVTLAFAPIIMGLVTLIILARHLNVLSLGEAEAKSLGMNILLYRSLFLFIASLITAVAVCVSGMIGFVGLVVPHIIRILIGPDHRTLLPAAALSGALFLLLCDTLGRTIAAPLEIRVGIMTAVIGAPYFLYLIRRMRRHGGMG